MCFVRPLPFVWSLHFSSIHTPLCSPRMHCIERKPLLSSPNPSPPLCPCWYHKICMVYHSIYDFPEICIAPPPWHSTIYFSFLPNFRNPCRPFFACCVPESSISFFISPISIGAPICFKLQKHGIISLASITLMYIYSSIYCILKTRIFGFISFLRSLLFKFRGKTPFSLDCISRPSTMNTPYLLLLHLFDRRG